MASADTKALVDQVVGLKQDITDAVNKLIYSIHEVQELAQSQGDESAAWQSGLDTRDAVQVYLVIKANLDRYIERLEEQQARDRDGQGTR